MKRIFLLIGITLFTLVSYGQTTYFGIKGGLNLSSFIDNNNYYQSNKVPTHYKGKIGFYIGGFLSLEVDKKLSVRPELLYSQQNSDFTIDTGDLTFYGVAGTYIIPQIKGEIKESILLTPIIL